MRVMFITSDLKSGGAQRVVSLLANSFVKTDDTYVVTIQGDRVKYHIDSAIHYIPIIVGNKNKILRVVERIYSLIKIFIKTKPDVILSFETENNIYSLFCNILLKNKIIISERNDPYNDPPSRITRFIRDRIYVLSDGFVFQTEDASKYFNKQIQGRSVVIPNPINEDFAVNKISNNRKKEIVNVCRLSSQKNLKLYLDIVKSVFDKHEDYSAVIYGEGPEKERLIEYAQKIGIKNKVFFPGFCNNVRDAIYDSSVYLCTSDYEGISNSLLEAMALGLPIVATDCPIGGTKMAIQHNYNGLLFNVGDKDNAIQLVNSIIENHNLSVKLGTNAIKIKNKWSIKIIESQWRDFINKIL